MRLSLPVSGMLMNQDMKSNYLDRPVGFMEFTSGPNASDQKSNDLNTLMLI